MTGFKKKYFRLLFLTLLALIAGFFILSLKSKTLDTADPAKTKAPPVYRYKIINTYPHDKNAFTQGLVFDNGFLYEGTGRRGQSTLRKLELKTGNVLMSRKLPAKFFGEGITIYKNMIIQLTWQSNIGFVYSRENFALLREFSYPTEGWGITYDGESLIMSDGSSTLYYLNPETFEEIKRIEVYDSNGPVARLNELEYIQGEIYANLWQTDRIARIVPETGKVAGWVDLRGLSQAGNLGKDSMLNGIAYDKENDRLFVTGKLWTELFEIKLIPLNK